MSIKHRLWTPTKVFVEVLKSVFCRLLLTWIHFTTTFFFFPTVPRGLRKVDLANDHALKYSIAMKNTTWNYNEDSSGACLSCLFFCLSFSYAFIPLTIPQIYLPLSLLETTDLHLDTVAEKVAHWCRRQTSDRPNTLFHVHLLKQSGGMFF